MKKISPRDSASVETITSHSYFIGWESKNQRLAPMNPKRIVGPLSILTRKFTNKKDGTCPGGEGVGGEKRGELEESPQSINTNGEREGPRGTWNK